MSLIQPLEDTGRLHAVLTMSSPRRVRKILCGITPSYAVCHKQNSLYNDMAENILYSYNFIITYAQPSVNNY